MPVGVADSWWAFAQYSTQPLSRFAYILGFSPVTLSAQAAIWTSEAFFFPRVMLFAPLRLVSSR